MGGGGVGGVMTASPLMVAFWGGVPAPQTRGHSSPRDSEGTATAQRSDGGGGGDKRWGGGTAAGGAPCVAAPTETHSDPQRPGRPPTPPPLNPPPPRGPGGGRGGAKRCPPLPHSALWGTAHKQRWDHLREWGCPPPAPPNQPGEWGGGRPGGLQPHWERWGGGGAHPSRRGAHSSGVTHSQWGGGVRGGHRPSGAAQTPRSQRAVPPPQPPLLSGGGRHTAPCPTAPGPHILLRRWGGTAPTCPPPLYAKRGADPPPP